MACAVSNVVCGEGGQGALLGAGVLVLAFALCVVLPVIVISMRMLRMAKQNGGCAGCLDPYPMHAVVVSVPGYAPAPRGGSGAASSTTAGPSCNGPVAYAVPITQPASVKAAPGPREMH